MSKIKVKNITSWNLDFIPKSTNNISIKLNNSKKMIQNISEYDNKDEYLYIYCVQKVYGYRVGIIGYAMHLSSFYLSKLFNPTFLKYVINNTFLNKIFGKINCNDFEAISYAVGSINSMIPLLNIGVWDIKPYLKDNLYCFINKNKSIPIWYNIFDQKFDSGCAIYSNKESTETGFERWILNKNSNKGITWSFFDYDTKILVVSVELNDNLNDMFYMNCITQLINFCKSKETQYNLKNIFISGDFKMNLSCKTKDICNIVLETMSTNNFRIFNNNGNNFIFCNNDNIHMYNSNSFSLEISPNSCLRTTIEYPNPKEVYELNINSDIQIDVNTPCSNDVSNLSDVIIKNTDSEKSDIDDNSRNTKDTNDINENKPSEKTIFTEISLDTYNPLNLITNYFKSDNISTKTSRSQSPSENEWTKL